MFFLSQISFKIVSPERKEEGERKERGKKKRSPKQGSSPRTESFVLLKKKRKTHKKGKKNRQKQDLNLRPVSGNRFQVYRLRPLDHPDIFERKRKWGETGCLMSPKSTKISKKKSSTCRGRTYDLAVNSRTLCQLS
jgi:hypothetical protein